LERSAAEKRCGEGEAWEMERMNGNGKFGNNGERLSGKREVGAMGTRGVSENARRIYRKLDQH
jgi:hypothetical protein